MRLFSHVSNRWRKIDCTVPDAERANVESPMTDLAPSPTSTRQRPLRPLDSTRAGSRTMITATSCRAADAEGEGCPVGLPEPALQREPAELAADGTPRAQSCP